MYVYIAPANYINNHNVVIIVKFGSNFISGLPQACMGGPYSTLPAYSGAGLRERSCGPVGQGCPRGPVGIMAILYAFSVANLITPWEACPRGSEGGPGLGLRRCQKSRAGPWLHALYLVLFIRSH